MTVIRKTDEYDAHTLTLDTDTCHLHMTLMTLIKDNDTWHGSVHMTLMTLIVTFCKLLRKIHYHLLLDAAALYDGTEGRVTNGVRDSAASLPADISNRSSYSIPATV